MSKKTLGKPKQILFFTLMVLSTLGLCFVVLELGLSRYYSEDQSGNPTTFHPVRGWALVPGDYSVKPLRSLNTFTLHIDDFGLRSKNSAKSRSDTRKMVVLGDSFTFAKESSTEKMFTQRLEVLMNQRLPGGFEVMNAGVPGYGTAQELLFMRELSEEHQINPEIYLLIFFTNDILDNLCLSYGDLAFQPIRPCFTPDEEGRLFLKPPEKHASYEDDSLVAAAPAQWRFKTITVAKAFAEEWLQTQPGLVRLLGEIGIRTQVARMPGLLNGWYREKIVKDGSALTGSLIRQMQQEIQAKGGQLIVSMIPSPFQVYPETYIPLLQKSFPGNPLVDRFAADMQRPQRLVQEMCLKAGVPFQDLLPMFLENHEKALFIPRDGHLTQPGHELVSELLLPFVLNHLTQPEH